MPGWLYLFDAQGRLYRWNKNVETVTGYTAEEVRLRNALAFGLLLFFVKNYTIMALPNRDISPKNT